jgi:hypothetical protein
MRIPPSAKLPDLQTGFREVWQALDRRPELDLQGKVFRNGGDATERQGLTTVSQVEGMIREAVASIQRDSTPQLVQIELPDVIQINILESDFQKTNNITLSDVGEMNFQVGSGETWVWECGLFVITNTVADIDYTFSGPTTSRLRFGITEGNVRSAGNAAVFGTRIDPTCSANPICHTMYGSLISTEDGVVQLRASQGAVDPINTTIRAGSYVQAIRIQ